MSKDILMFGDSITWGAWDLEGGWASRVKKYTDKQAIDGDFENYDSVYILGISGDDSEGLLRRFENEYLSRFDEESDMVFVIAIGINDSQFELKDNKNKTPISFFESNLSKIINSAHEKSNKIVFVGLTPVIDNLLNPMPWKPTHGYSNAQIEKYNSVVKDLATKNNLPFIDLFSHLINSDYEHLLSDGLHPNTKGHEVIYSIVLSELIKFGILI